MNADVDSNGSDGSSAVDAVAADAVGEREYRGSYVDRITLSRALVAGVVGGFFFGIPLQFVIERMAAIGAMYAFGVPSVTVGWVAHLTHSALFGVVFGMVTEVEPFHAWMERNVGVAGLVGLGFAVGLYAVNIVVVWPFWLGTVGYPPAEAWSIPHTPLAPLVGHLLWGAVTGVVFHLLVDY